MKTAALYIRVSSEEQALHGDSLQAQEAALREYASSEDYKVYRVYRDEGFSARKPALSRPAMQELLRDVEQNKFDTILFVKLDRWFRNVKEYYKVQEVLDRHKVTWKAILEDYSTDTADARLKLNVLLSVAENEADRTSERLKFVFDSKIRNKEPVTGKQPYGYMIAEIDGKKRVVKNPDTEEIVSATFEHFLTYKSIHGTVKHINLTYGVYRNNTATKKLLLDERYCGIMRGVEDYNPAYITKDQHDEIVRIISGKMVERHYGTESKAGVAIFKGLIRCPDCGNLLYKHTHVGYGRKGQRYYSVHYICVKHRYHACTYARSVSQKKIEQWAVAQIRAELEKYELTYDVQLKEKKRAATDKIPSLRARLSRLNDAYELGNIERDEYIAKTKDIKEQIAELEKIEADDSQGKSVEELKALINSDFLENYKTFSAEEKKAYWSGFVKEIVMDDNQPKEIVFL